MQRVRMIGRVAMLAALVIGANARMSSAQVAYIFHGETQGDVVEDFTQCVVANSGGAYSSGQSITCPSSLLGSASGAAVLSWGPNGTAPGAAVSITANGVTGSTYSNGIVRYNGGLAFLGGIFVGGTYVPPILPATMVFQLAVSGSFFSSSGGGGPSSWSMKMLEDDDGPLDREGEGGTGIAFAKSGFALPSNFFGSVATTPDGDGGITGTFSGIIPIALPVLAQNQTIYTWTEAGTGATGFGSASADVTARFAGVDFYDAAGNNVSATTAYRSNFVTVTPEPGTLILVATELCALGLIVRKRRRDRHDV